MYALDTNTLLDFFRQKGNVGAKLLAVPPSEIMLPAIVVYELWVGVLGSRSPARRREEFERFLSLIEIVSFTPETALRAGELRIALERKGESIGPLDTLIAATALSYGATLVTRNVREFSRVPGLKVENWHDA